MQVVDTPADLENLTGGVLVPTMGALHEGHLALVRRARSLGGPLVVTIFVNPTQFGPGEDWDRYPRSLDTDVEAAGRAGADIVFAPDVQTMYPPDREMPVPALPAVATTPGLEDAHRPGHFAGVCQVVARLFDLTMPVAAVFGEKDYQQLLVVTDIVRAEPRRWPGLEIVGQPTVRDVDGLALSSRNARLPAAERDRALGLWRALESARRSVPQGTRVTEAQMHRILTEHRLEIDYAVIRDARTLQALGETPAAPARALVAACLGDVRLIDNVGIADSVIADGVQ